jgi:hypothetical protein
VKPFEWFTEEITTMTASDLLQRHFQTLVADNGQWQTLIADDLLANEPRRIACSPAPVNVLPSVLRV